MVQITRDRTEAKAEQVEEWEDINLKKGHVHFSEDTDEVGHTEINLKIKSSNNIEAHIGFLQIHHKYLIILKLPEALLKDVPEVKDVDVPNLNAQIIKIVKNEEKCFIELHLHFVAYKEKLLKEKIALLDSNGDEISLTIFARVLGKGKGTPMLRENVTFIGIVDNEDESEASDWQGFG